MSKARDLANAGTALTTVSATELGYLDGVTSAVQTQVDAKIAKTLTTTTGDIIYASGANTPARLGIGSSAQVLTVAAGAPVWAAAGGGSLTLLSTTTLSGSTTTISSISGSYSSLYAIIKGVTASATYQLRIAPNADGVNAFGNTVVGVSGTVTNAQYQYEYIKTTGTGMVSSNSGNAFALTINNYASATSYKPVAMYGFFNSDSGISFNYFGGYMSNTAITSLQFSPSTGTFSTGTVLLYGVN